MLPKEKEQPIEDKIIRKEEDNTSKSCCPFLKTLQPPLKQVCLLWRTDFCNDGTADGERRKATPRLEADQAQSTKQQEFFLEALRVLKDQ